LPSPFAADTGWTKTTGVLRRSVRGFSAVGATRSADARLPLAADRSAAKDGSSVRATGSALVAELRFATRQAALHIRGDAVLSTNIPTNTPRKRHAVIRRRTIVLFPQDAIARKSMESGIW
jgi:hypothetical protein